MSHNTTAPAVFTPGPWVAESTDGKTAIVLDSHRQIVACASYTSPTAAELQSKAVGRPFFPMHGLANARLIAAAPDLLAALRLALTAIPTDAMVYSEGDHGERVYVADAIRAAIAKTDG